MRKKDNWTEREYDGGYAWEDEQSMRELYLISRGDYGEDEDFIQNNPDADWILATDNFVLDKFSGSKEEAREKARDWLFNSDKEV